MPVEPNDSDDDVQYRFIELDVGRIRYAMYGREREIVLLIHGFGGDLDNWVLNIDAFADIATVYALDLPGHGQSTKTMAARPVEGLVQAVLQFIERLDLAPAHVVGHSLGGLVAMLAAKVATHRLRSLVLIASAGLGSELNNTFVRDFIAASTREELQPVLEQLFDDPSHLNPALMEETLGYKKLPGVAEALAALHADLVVDGRQRRVLPVDLAALAVPVLAIAGREDKIMPPGHTFALRDKVKVSIVREAGHMVTMEKYKTINTLLRQHLTS